MCYIEKQAGYAATFDNIDGIRLHLIVYAGVSLPG
jgi:hypothetical protein